MSTLTVSSA